VEIIHERALRFIYNENYSTYMRMHTIAIETFKIVDKERPLLVDDQLSPSTNYAIPRSLTSSSVFIILSYKSKEILLDCVFLPIAIT
jgi:hypothetical protein